MGTKFGPQPAHWIIYREHLNIRSAALEIGVPYQHLSKAVRGYYRPDEVVREKLPALLKTPLEDLFTAESLKPFSPKHRAVSK